MSIIYDALKKVEVSVNKDSLDKTKVDKKTYGPKLKIYLLFTLVIGSGFFIANIVFNLFTKPSQRDVNIVSKIQPQVNKGEDVNSASELPQKITNPEPNLATAPVEVEKPSSPLLVLNGIFFSRNEGYALINNSIVKASDTIDGAVVTRITLDGVELKFQDSVIKLSTSGKQY